MANFEHTIVLGWNDGSRGISTENAYEGGAQGPSIDEEITADAVDQLVSFALDVSQLKAIFILAQGNMTLETNSGAAPDDTINLKAGVPYIWTTDSYDTCKLTVDVTKLYMTETSSATNRLRIECVFDATP